jgi:hypothetical protein
MQNSWPIELLEKSVVSYTFVSQSAGVETLEIIDSAQNVVVQTSVKSTNLSNESIGNFEVGDNPNYTVKISSCKDVKKQESNIVGQDVVTKSFLFAGEDSTDNDYNDAFCVITSFKNAS